MYGICAKCSDGKVLNYAGSSLSTKPADLLSSKIQSLCRTITANACCSAAQFEIPREQVHQAIPLVVGCPTCLTNFLNIFANSPAPQIRVYLLMLLLLSSSSYLNCFSGLKTLQTAKLLKTCIKLARKSAQFQMYSSDHVGERGALIVLEGLDRCGKTTQCGSLVSFLERRGISVEAWRFPDRNTDIGRMISSYLTNKSQLDDQTIHLLFSANRWEKRPLMENKLRNGTTLVVDRYSYSGVSFSAAKGLDIEWCKTPEKGLIAPDLVVYLDIMPEEAARRGGYGTERYEQLEFQRIVAHHYQNLKDASWRVIDARLPRQSIENLIQELALDSIKSCQKRPLSSLWLTD